MSSHQDDEAQQAMVVVTPDLPGEAIFSATKWGLALLPVAVYIGQVHVVVAAPVAAVCLIPATILTYRLLLSLSAHTNGTIAAMYGTFISNYFAGYAALPLSPIAFEEILQSCVFNVTIGSAVMCLGAWYGQHCGIAPHPETLKSAKLWLAASVVLSGTFVSTNGFVTPTIYRIANLVSFGLPAVFCYNWWHGTHAEPPTAVRRPYYSLWLSIGGLTGIVFVMLLTWPILANANEALFPAIGSNALVRQSFANLPWFVLDFWAAFNGEPSLAFALATFAGFFDTATALAFCISLDVMPTKSTAPPLLAVVIWVVCLFTMDLFPVRSHRALLTTVLYLVGAYALVVAVTVV